MLKQLITAFVGANVISEGASYLLGEGNPIAQGVQAVTSGSFLSGTGQPSTTSFQTNNLRSKSMDEKLDDFFREYPSLGKVGADNAVGIIGTKLWKGSQVIAIWDTAQEKWIRR